MTTIHLKLLKKDLFNYIRKNPYIQKLNQIRKEELKELIGQTKHEISKLDSLQDEEYFRDKDQPAIKGKSAFYCSTERNPVIL